MTAGHWNRTLTFLCVLIVSATPLQSRAESTEEIIFTAQAEPFSAEAEADDEAEADAAASQALPALYDPEDVITLREAAILALQNNLDIELARLDPEIAEEGVQEAKGVFDPVGSATFNFARNARKNTNSLDPQSALKINGWDYGTGVSGILPFGLSYRSGVNLNRNDTNSRISSLARTFRSGWTSELSMPLLRDLRVNRASVAVRQSQIAEKSSEDRFAQTLSELVAGVENLYWNLAAADASLSVAQKSLKAANDLLDQTRIQEEVGVVSRIAVKQAEAGVAEREVNLINAENQAASARDQLLDAIFAPESIGAFDDRQVLTQRPQFEFYPVDVAEAVKKALKLRPEMAMAKKAVDSASLASDLAKNQAKPRFDLVATYSTEGLAGSENGESLSPPRQNIVGDSGDSFRDFFGSTPEKNFSWGVQVEVPFGNRTGKAGAARARIEERRARIGLRRQRQLIALEVRRAARDLASASKAVKAAERRRGASEESLRAEQERLRLGDSTPFQVLQFEEDVADAESQVINTLRLLQNSITEFERVQGTLLSARGISVEEAIETQER